MGRPHFAPVPDQVRHKIRARDQRRSWRYACGSWNWPSVQFPLLGCRADCAGEGAQGYAHTPGKAAGPSIMALQALANPSLPHLRHVFTGISIWTRCAARLPFRLRDCRPGIRTAGDRGRKWAAANISSTVPIEFGARETAMPASLCESFWRSRPACVGKLALRGCPRIPWSACQSCQVRWPRMRNRALRSPLGHPSPPDHPARKTFP